MSRRLGIVLGGCVGLGILLFLGYYWATHRDGERDKNPPLLTERDLHIINTGYLNFYIVYQRPPTDLDEFAPFVVATTIPESWRKHEEECLRHLKEGKYVVVWKPRGPVKSNESTVVTAYERRTAEEGGYVIFADARVQWMSPAELEQATRSEPSSRSEPGTARL
jgi:hypothetical protein